MFNGRNAPELTATFISVLAGCKPHLKTITSGNCMEFADHQTVAKELDAGFYFARPYHRWERASKENLNGLIIQYIPKKTDLA